MDAPESIQTPCISDNIMTDDFSQIQSSVNASTEYDLQVFTPGFDTSGNTYVDSPSSTLKPQSSSSTQQDDKHFLVEENAIDMHLYESLQSHHNYSLKSKDNSISKSASSNVEDFVISQSLSRQITGAEDNIDSIDDSEDQSMDMSDPLREICRSSSPLYVPPVTSSNNGVATSQLYSKTMEDQVHEPGKDSNIAGKGIEQQTNWTILKQNQNEDEEYEDEDISKQISDVKHEIDTISGRNVIDKSADTVTVINKTHQQTIDDDNSLDRTVQEKTMFSENLGLMPADNEAKALRDKRKTSRKGVRTRRSFEASALRELSENVPETGHRHLQGVYRCGSCNKMFVQICKLHHHLLEHNSGGNYQYNHSLKTAYPKLDTSCAFTQTGDKTPKFTPRIKPFKGAKVKENKTSSLVDEEATPVKKKRGRPRKIKDENTSPDRPKNEKVVGKLKIRTDDGGNTWTGLDNTAKENADTYDMNSMIEIVIDRESEDEEQTKRIDNIVQGNDIENIDRQEIEKPINLPRKASRKRKMSVPRKISHSDSAEDESKKIVNSRSKPDDKIKCDFCPSEFLYTRGLIRHEQEKHADEMKHECEVCHQRFMRGYNLERHKLCSHTTGKSKILRQRKGIAIWREKKKRGRKPIDRSPEENTTCEVCGKQIPASKTEIHQRIHSGERPFICHICGKGLISDKKLKRHLLIHSENKKHTCEVCGQGFAMKNKLRTHMFIHTGHKPYLCSACGAEFNNSTSLLHHHRTVHLGDKRFECTVCGGRYGKKSQLEEHMFSHSNKRTQTCRYCKKTFKHAKSLRRHEFTHVSDQKFACDQCDSKFSRKDNLERHKMCHFQTNLQCKFCKKKFLERKPLLEHEQFHINQRKFQCQICKDKFQEESYFYNHMEKEHKMSSEMVDTLIANREKEENEVGQKDLLSQGLLLDTAAENLEQQNALTLTQDTLNYSMNVAGIIPSTGQDLLPCTTATASLHGLAQLHTNNNQSLNTGQNIVLANGTRILNQPGNLNFTTQIIPGLLDSQRATFSTISTPDNGGLRLSVDQQNASLPLTTSESLIIHEQQRLMQEALNMQNTGLRMQNMY